MKELTSYGIRIMLKPTRIYHTISGTNGLWKSLPISTISADLASHITKSAESSTFFKVFSAKIASQQSLVQSKIHQISRPLFSQTACNTSWSRPTDTRSYQTLSRVHSLPDFPLYRLMSTTDPIL